MIKFFIKIRKNLLIENLPTGQAGKTGKYFKYAIGEILLVVIGILIALSINTWNQKRLNTKEEGLLLEAISQKMVLNAFQHQLGLKRNIEVIEASKQLISLSGQSILDSSKNSIEQNLFSIKKRFLMGKSNETSIYDELMASGQLNLLKSKKLRSELTKLKANLQLLASYETLQNSFVDNHLSQYLNQHIDFRTIYNNAEPTSAYDKLIALDKIPVSLGEQSYSELFQNQIFYNMLIELTTHTKTLLPVYKRIGDNIHVIDSISSSSKTID